MPDTFAARLRQARLAKRYTQHRLELAARLTPYYVSQLELGHISQPDAAKLNRLAQALDVSGLYLLTGETEDA